VLERKPEDADARRRFYEVEAQLRQFNPGGVKPRPYKPRIERKARRRNALFRPRLHRL